LGKAYLHIKQFSKAAENLRAARAIDTYGDVHFQLAQALKQIGDEAGAEAARAESRRIREAQLEREQRLRLGP
jgi:uncharacterized protein HemY